jgi:hypothetical protein
MPTLNELMQEALSELSPGNTFDEAAYYYGASSVLFIVFNILEKQNVTVEEVTNTLDDLCDEIDLFAGVLPCSIH